MTRSEGPVRGVATRTKGAETNRLFDRWRLERDSRAREELVRRFLPLARKLALKYARASEPLDDLVQVAAVGLLGAIDRFDPGRGKSFSSFAVPTILGELKRHFRDHCWSLHVPRTEQELALKVRAGEMELTARRGAVPTVAQLAELLEVSIEEVCDGLEVNHANNRISLDAPVGDEASDGPTSLGETVGAIDDRYELVHAASSLAAAMRRLPEDDQRLLSLRLGQQLTQREIGAMIGVSQMQVSRLLRAALGRLRDLAGADAPRGEAGAVAARPATATDEVPGQMPRPQAHAPRPSSRRARFRTRARLEPRPATRRCRGRTDGAFCSTAAPAARPPPLVAGAPRSRRKRKPDGCANAAAGVRYARSVELDTALPER